MAEHDLELLSALKDGELDEQQTARLLSRLTEDGALRQRWHRYHLVGDVMRNNIPTLLKHDLAGRISTALLTEPTVLSPSSPRTLPVIKPKHDKTFTGYAVAASVAVVGFLTVGLVSNKLGQDPTQLANVAPVLATSGLLAQPAASISGAEDARAVVSNIESNVAGNTERAVPVTLQAEEPNLQPYMLHHELSAPAMARSSLTSQVRVVTFSSDESAQQ